MIQFLFPGDNAGARRRARAAPARAAALAGSNPRLPLHLTVTGERPHPEASEAGTSFKLNLPLFCSGVVDGAGGDGHVEQRVGDVAGVAAGQLHLGRGEFRGGVVGGEEPRERRRR